MTEPTGETKRRCEWCRRPLAESKGTGRPRNYCRQSCRQRAYEARRQAEVLGLSENELVVTRQELERLLDQIYVLSAAIEDVDRDLAADGSASEVRRSLDWLLSAARPLAQTPLL